MKCSRITDSEKESMKCLEELIRWEMFYYQKKSKHIFRNKMKSGGRKNVKVKQGTNNRI